MFVCPINLIMMWTWRFYIKPLYLSRYPWEPLMTYLQQTTRPTSYQLENTVWEGWGQWHLTPPKIKYCKFHTGILNSVPCSLCHQIWCFFAEVHMLFSEEQLKSMSGKCLKFPNWHVSSFYGEKFFEKNGC